MSGRISLWYVYSSIISQPQYNTTPFTGLYSGIFVLYLQHHSSKRGTHSDSKILLYALCALYVLSLVSLVIDLINFMIAVSDNFIQKNDHVFLFYYLDSLR